MTVHALPFERIKLYHAPIIYENGPDWRWVSTQRSHYNLWICMEGHGQMRCGRREYPISPWTAFVLPPAMSVSGDARPGKAPIKNFTAHWLPVEIETPFSVYPLLGMPLREVDTVRAMIRSLVRLSVYDDPLARQQGEWTVLELLALIWREVQLPRLSAVDEIIYQQVERMRSGRDLFVSVDELAAQSGLSRMHYSRSFRRITGESPNRFMIQQRLERACVLLRETDWTVDTVAKTIGYADLFFFCRQFRRFMQTTPKRYRQAAE